jgi:uncharacterized Zn finger protein
MSAPEEYVTIKVKRRVKEALLRMQALLQYKERQRFSISDIVEFLVANAPEIQVPIDEELRIVFPEEHGK